jgi:putative oxidoreductase
MSEAQAKPKLLLPFLQPFYDLVVPLSWPLIRVTVGGTMLAHGYARLFGPPLAAAAAEFAKNGYQPALLVAYIVFINETIGAVCVMLGLFTRFFAASIAIELAVISLLFVRNGWAWAHHGWEYVFLWGLIFFAIALRGGGPYSLDRKIGWEL